MGAVTYRPINYTRRVTGRIWLHGVSVGETVAALRLARALADHLPIMSFTHHQYRHRP